MQQEMEIAVFDSGPAPRRFTVSSGGLSFGRSSSNDVAIADEELSRNHGMFELLGDGAIQVIDLASANGTYVNGELLGSEPRVLKAGDTIIAGSTTMKIVLKGEPAAIEGTTAVPTPFPGGARAPSQSVDLGLGFDSQDAAAPSASGGAAGGASGAKRSSLANMAWGGAVVLFAISIAMILSVPSSSPKKGGAKKGEAAPARLHVLSYEKVEADSSRIFRYAMTVDSDGTLRVVYDDVPGEDRHVDKSTKLGKAAIDYLSGLFSGPKWLESEEAFTGASAESENALTRMKIRTVIGMKTHEVLVENSVEPEFFKEIREALEAFSRNELGVWALQYSREQLLKLAAESEKVGDARFEEADVEYGNVAAAVKAYNDAVFYLDTVNPKPSSYSRLKESQRKAVEELDSRYRDQRFVADKALNMGDWETAARELKVLIEIISDKNDERSIEAKAKLVDVEERMKKKKKGGKGK